MNVKRESEVAQSCLTPSDPMDCSPPGSSVHGIFQARVLEWGAIASLQGLETFGCESLNMSNSVSGNLKLLLNKIKLIMQVFCCTGEM